MQFKTALRASRHIQVRPRTTLPLYNGKPVIRNTTGRQIERLEPGQHEHVTTGEEASVSGGPSSSEIAMPRTAFTAPPDQAPGRHETWSRSQNPRANAMRGPRFEQTAMQFQPKPLPAIELIADEPIRLVDERIAVCDGGGGPLGHPKIYINLDKPGPKPCGYCGIRFERDPDAHHHH